MRKILAMMLCAAMMLGLAGCGEKDPVSAKIGESFEIGDWKAEVTAYEYAEHKTSSEDSFFGYEADSGNILLVLDITAVNNGSDEDTFMKSTGTTADIAVTVDYEGETLQGLYVVGMTNLLFNKTADAGEEIEGSVLFELPEAVQDQPEGSVVIAVTKGKDRIEISL